MATAKTFNDLIRPYFTPCYRAHMLKISRPLDLWDPDAVKTNWQLIFDAVQSGFMPMPGCGTKRQRFGRREIVIPSLRSSESSEASQKP